MATKPRVRPLKVATCDLLELTHQGSSGTTEQQAAADSVRSLVALKLAHRRVTVPVAMQPYYYTLKSIK